MVQDNWLNTVTLGTYKFTFYVVDSDVHNQPDQWLGLTDEPALSAGKACIIAESGVEGAYAIENVMIMSTAASPQTGFANITQITFDLLEPLGFSLLDRLLTVGKDLKKETPSGVNMQSLLFVLKLDFLGRDSVSGAAVKFPSGFLYPGSIRAITGSLGAAGAKYFIDFAPKDWNALHNSVTPSDVSVPNVSTVETFGTNLQSALNSKEYELMDERQDKPLREWRIVLDPTLSIEARDIYGLASFDLRSAPWAGTASSDNSGGQSESLEELGVREVVLNNETQIAAKIKDLIASNTPTFATYSEEALERAGITYAIETNAEVEMLGEMDPILNQERRRITLTVRLRTDFSATPLNPDSITAIRNSRRIQEERLSELMPTVYKKYSYQYTGENTEVIDINLELNNLFFNARAPMGGIYYADNSNMFESTVTPIEETTDQPPVSATTPTESRASARYLSDIRIPKINILQSPVFNIIPVGPGGQQVNETTVSDRIAAAALNEHANRTIDAINLEIQVRGDPIFMGNNGQTIFARESQSVYMAFVNFQPEPEDLLERQQRGPVDMITTGLYIITNIESKFQQGQFVQRIQTRRDENINSFLLLDRIIGLGIN